MSDFGKITYFIPAYNEAGIIESTARKILDKDPSFEVWVCVNGSSDDTQDVLTKTFTENPRVRVFGIKEKGLGLALSKLFKEYYATGTPNDTDWVLITGADLPFGFSDWESFKKAQATNPNSYYIGSKSHLLSDSSRSFGRIVLSRGFNFLKRLLLGINTQDTQGTHLINAIAARNIALKIQSADYLFTLEFVFIAAKQGLYPTEVPIVFRESGGRKSSIRNIRDITRMFKGILSLRRRKYE